MERKADAGQTSKPVKGYVSLRGNIGGESFDFSTDLPEKLEEVAKTLSDAKDRIQELIPQVGTFIGNVEEWKKRSR